MGSNGTDNYAVLFSLLDTLVVKLYHVTRASALSVLPL
jgi:hypothetical protein